MALATRLFIALFALAAFGCSSANKNPAASATIDDSPSAKLVVTANRVGGTREQRLKINLVEKVVPKGRRTLLPIQLSGVSRIVSNPEIEVEVSYNPQILTMDGISSTGSLSSGFGLIWIEQTPGRWRFQLFSTSRGITHNGEIFSLIARGVMTGYSLDWGESSDITVRIKIRSMGVSSYLTDTRTIKVGPFGYQSDSPSDL